MIYNIIQTINHEEKNEQTINLTLDADNKSFELTAYSVKMQYSDFLKFAAAVDELKAKLQTNEK